MRVLLPFAVRRSKAAAAAAPTLPSTPTQPQDIHEWRHVRSHHWNPATHGFNAENAKMVCTKCHRHLPFEMKCTVCGGCDFELGSALGAPAVYCRDCREGQMHWDCPVCGHRQSFARGFYYDQKHLKIA